MANGVLGFSDAYIHKLQQRAVTGGTPTMAATPYVGLIVVPPTSGAFSDLTELTAGDYARKLAGFGTPAARQTANAAEIVLQANPASAWYSGAPIRWFGLFETLASADCFFVGQIQNAISVSIGNPVKIPVGALRIFNTLRTFQYT